MAGFFSTIKAIHHCSSELLTVGKEYALKFKKNEIDARQYEYEMVGKIYELTNKYAEGDEDLEKHLKQHFADSMTKFLKEGIQLYTESLDQANKNKDEDIPQEIPENKEKTRMSESIEHVNSSHNVVTSSNVIETIDNIKSILAEINPYTGKHGGYYEDKIPKGFKIPKEKQEGYKESQKAEISRIQDKFYDSSKLGNLQNNEYNIYGVETALKNMGFKIVNDEKSKTELSKKGITITLSKEKEFINKNKLQDVLKYMIEVFPQGALTKFDNEYNKLGLVAGKKDNLKKKLMNPSI